MVSTLRRRAGLIALGAVLMLVILVAPAGAASTEPHGQPPGLDHFHCYRVTETTQAHFTPPAQVGLKDQFGAATVNVGGVVRLCNPTLKTRLDTGESSPPQNPRAHLACFAITQTGFQPVKVQATNQFGSALLDVSAPIALCLPSFKQLDAPNFPDQRQPDGLDHFKCYGVKYTLNAAGNPTDPFGLEPANVISKDQFGEKLATLGRPVLLCNPVEKTRTDLPAPEQTPIRNPDAHLVCFRSEDDQRYAFRPWVKNQFGIAQVQGTEPSPGTTPLLAGDLLCLPSFKAAPK
jgi:hypothetical protein